MMLFHRRPTSLFFCFFLGLNQGVPAVCIVVEGGPAIVSKVLDYVSNVPPVPVFVFEGSGRAADLLAFLHKQTALDRFADVTCLMYNVMQHWVKSKMWTWFYIPVLLSWLFKSKHTHCCVVCFVCHTNLLWIKCILIMTGP